jgi:hypothetical protein
VEIDGDLEYKVEQILDSWIHRNKFQYLIKWKGYTEERNTWEPVDNLANTQAAIKDFHHTHPAAPCCICSLDLF